MDKQQKKEFEAIVNLMIDFLNNNGHPHMKVIVDTTSAEIVEGICVYNQDIDNE